MMVREKTKLNFRITKKNLKKKVLAKVEQQHL